MPWRLQPLTFGQQQSPEHLARHPFGRIPAIEHGDFKLYECQAILRYIDAAFDGPSLTPREPKAMARMSWRSAASPIRSAAFTAPRILLCS